MDSKEFEEESIWASIICYPEWRPNVTSCLMTNPTIMLSTHDRLYSHTMNQNKPLFLSIALVKSCQEHKNGDGYIKIFILLI